MSVVYGVMRCIGWILLAVVLILLILILLVLLSPLTYRVQTEVNLRKEAPAVQGTQISVHYLCWLLGLRICQREEGWAAVLRILFFHKTIPLGKDISTSEEMSQIEEEDSEEDEDIEEDDLQEGDLQDDGLQENGLPEEDLPKDVKEDDLQEEPSEEPEEQTEEEPQKKEKTVERIKEKYQKFKESKDKIKQILTDEGNQRTFQYLKNSLLRLLKMLMPRKGKVHLSYSTGAPDTTALSFGALSLFPIVYKQEWEIFPNFESEEYFVEGNLDVKGWFCLISILILALRVVLNKDCRRSYRMLTKLKKSKT